MSNPKRAINLARVSTERQAKLYSLDYQLEQEQAYCDEMGLLVVAEFKDDVTGRKMERDGLETACQMLERDEADVLVTWKFDRLHRNYVNSVLLRERVRNAGKELHYAQTRQISGKTARERLPEDIQYMLAEIEADDIAERMDMGKRRAIEKGKRWVAFYKQPYGYVKVGHGHDARMQIDEWEALLRPETQVSLSAQLAQGRIPTGLLIVIQAGKATACVVRLIFVWYVFGDEDGKPLGVPTIGQKLTALGIPTPQDLIADRQHRKKRGYANWSYGAIYRILHESAYMGTFYHFRSKMVNGVKQPIADKESWRGVPVPQIVDEDLFAAAQAKLQAGQRLSKRSSTESYLIGRRIQCECGYKMQANKTTRSYTRKDGTKITYYSHVYRCPGRYASVRRMHRCDMPQLDYRTVDARVWEWVKDDIGNPVVLERKLREIQAEQQRANSGKEETRDTIRKHKEELEAELKNLGALYANTAMPKHIVDELIAEKSQALRLTEAELSKITHEIRTPLTDDTIQSLLLFSMDFHERLAQLEQSFEGRRTVIDGLDVTATAIQKDGEVWLKLTSLLRPEGITILLTPTAPHSVIANGDP